MHLAVSGYKERVQMGEKVVLPKFDLPGDRRHPAVKIVIAVGALCLVCMLALGGAFYHRMSLQEAAVKRQNDLVAARLAEANAKAEEAKARAAEAAARTAADQARAAEALAAKKAAKEAEKLAEKNAALADAGSKKGSHHKGSSKASAASSKTVAAKTPADDKKAAPKAPGSKRDDAAIDKLLASFK
jgi:Na+-transporting NADH:ubiquinone oxidoreductase subunit NqrC